MTSSSDESAAGSMNSSFEEEAEDDFVEVHSFWDWPLTENGVARCVESKHRFTATLHFSYLRHTVVIRKFENYKSSNSSWSLGLNHVEPANHTDAQSFWRLEIDTVPRMNMIIIETHREVCRTSKNAKSLKSTRKMYRIPKNFDMETLETTFSPESSSVVIAAQRKKESVVKRKDSVV